MSEQRARQLIMLHRLRAFIKKTEAISEDLKGECIQIIDKVIDPPEKGENLDLLSCFQFMKSVVNVGRYPVEEFLPVLESLEYLNLFEETLKKEAEKNGKKDR